MSIFNNTPAGTGIETLSPLGLVRTSVLSRPLSLGKPGTFIANVRLLGTSKQLNSYAQEGKAEGLHTGH
jgi:hypothetical protein